MRRCFAGGFACCHPTACVEHVTTIPSAFLELGIGHSWLWCWDNDLCGELDIMTGIKCTVLPTVGADSMHAHGTVSEVRHALLYGYAHNTETRGSPSGHAWLFCLTPALAGWHAVGKGCGLL